MLTTYQVMLWIKDFCSKKAINIGNFYTGTITNKMNSLGVFNISQDIPFTAIGGLSATTNADISISILIYFNKNYKETEEESIKLYEALQELEQFTIDSYQINHLDLLTNYPKDIGADDTGVYKRVINFRLNYEK